MAKTEKIRNTQVVDNKEDKFFYFPMVSMGCTGSGYSEILTDNDCGDFLFLFLFYAAQPQSRSGDFGAALF